MSHRSAGSFTLGGDEMRGNRIKNLCRKDKRDFKVKMMVQKESKLQAALYQEIRDILEEERKD